MKIAVTQEHIDKGDRQNCRECPVALAAKEALKTSAVEVLYHSMVVQGHRYTLPTEAAVFVSAFDDRGRESVKPFKFDLALAAELR